MSGCLLPLLFLFIPTLAFGQVPFERIFGGDGWEEAYSVQETRDGGIVLAGGTSSFGLGSHDFYVVKTDAFGDTLWTRTFGTPASDIAQCVRQTPDGGYIVAGYTSGGMSGLDFFLVRTDSSGNEMWRRQFDAGLDEIAYAVQPVSDGGFILVGSSKLSFPSLSSEDIFVVKTNASGDSSWARIVGGSGFEEARCVQEVGSGDFLVGGTTSSFGAGSVDFYLVRMDAFGDTLWTRTYGESSAESMYGMAATVDGGWVMAGSRNTGSGSFFHLIRLDSSADTLWTRTFPGDSSDVAYDVDVTADGGFVLTGSTADGPGGLDFCLLRTDSLGAQLWRRTYGGSDWDVAYAGEQTADGGNILGGYSRSFGGYQFYLVKTAADGATDVSTYVQSRSPICVTSVPNPFFRWARLNFDLPTAGRVRLVVYDIRGRQVATPFDGMLMQGVHALAWDAAALAPGVYPVRLHTEQGVGTMKLLLLRSP